MHHALLLSIVAGLLISSTGCSVMNHGREAVVKTSRMFRPNPHDMDDSADDAEAEWEFVGKEGRGDQPREVDPDPWFKKYIQSPKARSIERNLGVD